MLSSATPSERGQHAADAVHQNIHSHRPRAAGGASHVSSARRRGETAAGEEELTSLVWL